MAKPSTTAVFPTPASPVRIGLFWRRRIRISAICLISKSRPSTGSISPLRALSVRLMVNWSRAFVPAWALRLPSRSPEPWPAAGLPVLGGALCQVGEVLAQGLHGNLFEQLGGLRKHPGRLVIREEAEEDVAGSDARRLVS